MAKFKVTFYDESTETIEADRYMEINDWIDFDNIHGETLSRIRSNTVTRIDRIEG